MNDWKETWRNRSSFALSFVISWFFSFTWMSILNDESNTSCDYNTLTGTTGNWTTEVFQRVRFTWRTFKMRLLLEYCACAAAAAVYAFMYVPLFKTLKYRISIDAIAFRILWGLWMFGFWVCVCVGRVFQFHFISLLILHVPTVF